MIDGLCQRYGCLPSQLLAEEAYMVFQMAALLQEEKGEDGGGHEAATEEEELGLGMYSRPLNS